MEGGQRSSSRLARLQPRGSSLNFVLGIQPRPLPRLLSTTHSPPNRRQCTASNAELRKWDSPSILRFLACPRFSLAAARRIDTSASGDLLPAQSVRERKRIRRSPDPDSNYNPIGAPRDSRIIRARIVRVGTTAVSYESFVAIQPSYVLDRVQQAIPELPYTQVQPIQVYLTIRTRTTW